jgi:hypothetical protein
MKPQEDYKQSYTEQDTKELLELLRKLIEREVVEKITLTIKPKKKPKQP